MSCFRCVSLNTATGPNPPYGEPPWRRYMPVTADQQTVALVASEYEAERGNVCCEGGIDGISPICVSAFKVKMF
jgi:hypothetical protein